MNPIKMINKLEDFLGNDLEGTVQKVAAATGVPIDSVIDCAKERLKILQRLRVWNQNKKIFVVSQALVDALRVTDIPEDLTPSDFKYPFKDFTIMSPSGFMDLEIMMYDGKRVKHNINLIVVNTNVVHSDGVGTHYPQILITGVSNECSEISVALDYDSKFNDERLNRPQSLGLAALTTDEKTQLLNMVFNLILYINDSSRNRIDTEIPVNERSRHTHALFGKGEFCPYIYLKAPKAMTYTSTGLGKPLEKRFLVRGFYRNQPHGPLNMYRKLIWIMPFWKGPTLAEVISKEYVVK